MRVFFQRLGIYGSVSMMLPAVIALASPPASTPKLAPASEPRIVTQTTETAEPVTELPSSTSVGMDDFTLFPGQNDLTGNTGFTDQRFGYVLHGEVREAYESNIFIQRHGAEEDFIFSVAPGVAVGWGEFKSEIYDPDSFRHQFERYLGRNYFYVDYSPKYTWFASHSDQDTFDQDVKLAGEWTFKKLTIGINGRYVTANVPDADIGNRVKTKWLTGALTSDYDYSGKVSMEANVFYQKIEYDGPQIGAWEIRNEDWFTYKITPKIRAAVGATVAYLERENGVTNTYEQGRLRANYEVSAKMTLGLSGGVEFRQSDISPSRTTPIFQVDYAWSPFDGTYLYIEGFRRAVSSGSGSDDYYYATGFNFRVRQRLFQRYYFTLSGGYQNADYQTATDSPNAQRQSDLYYIRPAVGFDLASWLNCEIGAQYQKNESSLEERGFDATTATVRLNMLF